MVDTDLFVEALLNRNSNEAEYAEDFWEILKLQKVQAYVTEICLERIRSFASRLKSAEIAEEVIFEFQKVVEVCPVNRNTLEEARSLNIIDFEAAVELACTSIMNLDAIVARNPQDFPQETFRVYSVCEFLAEQLPENTISRYRTVLERQLFLPCPDNITKVQALRDELDCSLVIADKIPVNLSLWFQNVFQEGWQTVESIFGVKEATVAFNFRSLDIIEKNEIARRVKLINLGMFCGVKTIAMLVTITGDSEQKMGVRVQMYPVNETTYLPPKIKLVLLSEFGKKFQEVLSKAGDEMIQLKRFTCPFGKSFIVQIYQDNINVINEKFIA